MKTLNDFISLELLYEGSHTVTYRAFRAKDGLPVTLKFANLDTEERDKNIDALLHEYNILKYILSSTQNGESKAIVQFVELRDDGNQPVLITDNMPAVLLSKFQENRSLLLDNFFKWSLAFLDQLSLIHRLKIIHCDIRPQNILIDAETCVPRLVNFMRASRLTQSLIAEEVSPEQFKAALPYISPEQTGRFNRSIDYRSDYYSLGVTLYENLTGAPPFTTKDPLEIIYCHLTETPVLASIKNPEVPKQLAFIISKLLAKTPEDRYLTTHGLKADLEMCATQWKASQKIKSFALGSKDTPDVLNLSEKIHGRTEMLQDLITVYQKVAKGDTHLVLLSGEPGIGKTSLIKELYKPIAYNKGYFLKGKFDQHQMLLPYRAFIEAFEGLVHKLLKENKDRVNNLRTSILNVLGPNIAFIVNLIPSLEILVGKTPPPPDMPLHEIENKFLSTMRSFIRLFAHPNHPLVIFIDDWQWADSGSMKLLKAILVDNTIKHLMIIASYRDNEISPNHLLNETISTLKNRSINIQELHLEPLKIPHVQEWLSEILKVSQTESEPLASLLLEKTQGNPFFINEFLKTLNQRALLYYDHTKHRWNWSIKEIKKQSYTDNVIDFLIARLHQFPVETQEILKIASCIGYIFDAQLLAHVINKPIHYVLQRLWLAMDNNFIVAINQTSYLEGWEEDPLIQEGSTHYPDSTNRNKLLYRFVHDRVQQTCYSRLSHQEKMQYHLTIGRNLRDHTPLDDVTGQLAETVNHLNKGCDLVEDYDERRQIADLNLIVGQRTKASNAYELSLDYFLIGLGQLNLNAWEEDYKLIFSLYHEVAHSHYLCGDFSEAEELFNFLLTKAHSKQDLIQVYLSMGRLYIGQPNYLKAIESLNNALEILGNKINLSFSQLTIIKEMIWIRWNLSGKSHDELVNLPEMEEENAILLSTIYIMLGFPSILTNPTLFMIIVLRYLKLSLKKGNSSFAAMGYVGYATALLRGRYDCSKETEIKALKYIDIGLALVNKYNNKSVKAEFYQFYTLAFHFRRHSYRSCYEYFQEAYILSREQGNLVYAAHNLHHMESALFHAGESIPNILKTLEIMIEGVNTSNGQEELACLHIVKQFYDSLIDNTGIKDWSFEKFSGKELGVYPLDKKLLKAPTHFNIKRSFFCFLLGKYDDALWHFEKLTYIKNKKFPTFTIVWIHYYFIYPLVLCQLYHKASFLKKISYRWRIRSLLKVLKIRSETNPENHLNKYYLVLAEWNRVNGKVEPALHYYNEAITHAKKSGFIQDEAISYEMVGKFFLARNNMELAQGSLIKAYRLFESWGAKAKLTQMESEYPTIFFKKEVKKRTKDLFPTHRPEENTPLPLGTEEPTTITNLLKVTQTISSEIEINRLLEKIMSVFLEQAGAQRVVLLSLHDETWYKHAEGTANKRQLTPNTTLPLNEVQDIPKALINYVTFTKDPLIIDDASSQDDVAVEEPYLRDHDIKSVMILPVSYQGEVDHLFYLENNVLSGAFTKKKLEDLKFIASQAAISLEHAHLYNQVTHDPLTGLGNLNLLYHLFSQSIKATRERTMAALVLVDLDNFKSINDTFGHDIGDEVLVHVGKLLQQFIKEEDVIVRMGRDEFVILLQGLQNKQQIRDIVERFFNHLKSPFLIQGTAVSVSANMGIALYPYHGEDIKDLLKKADSALYKIKETGKNKFSFYEDHLGKDES